MLAYIIADDNPDGGYFAFETQKPTITRRTEREVREVELPDDLVEAALAGRLPRDEDGSNDSTWLEWWPKGRTVWRRD